MCNGNPEGIKGELPKEQQQVGHFIQYYTYHDVCVPIEKLNELLEAPEAALHAAQGLTPGFVVNVFQEDPHTHMVPEIIYGTGQGGHGDVVRFVESPVVGGKGAEKSQHVVDLKVEQVPLEEALRVVFDKDACSGGAGRVIGCLEGLQEKEERRIQDLFTLTCNC
uniref:Uncharacterized protein n=1 Tax=Hippocampus comes TaxID=109280 RepID=A0A3Q2XY69_HIPCM